MKTMGVDNETVPNYLNIVMDDSTKFLDLLRKQAESDGQIGSLEEGECKKLALTDDIGSLECNEYYFDECSNALEMSFVLHTVEGDVHFFYFYAVE